MLSFKRRKLCRGFCWSPSIVTVPDDDAATACFCVYQVKKVKKWLCKLCGQKQSLLKVWCYLSVCRTAAEPGFCWTHILSCSHDTKDRCCISLTCNTRAERFKSGSFWLAGVWARIRRWLPSSRSDVKRHEGSHDGGRTLHLGITVTSSKSPLCWSGKTYLPEGWKSVLIRLSSLTNDVKLEKENLLIS